jgi:hypothetical protein
MILVGFSALSVFLAERGVRGRDGVPILDSQAAIIKAAEMAATCARHAEAEERILRSIESGLRDCARALRPRLATSY